MIAPVPSIGAARRRDLREFTDTRAALAPADSEASEFDPLCAIGVLADIAAGGQEARRGGLADSGPLQAQVEGRARLQERDGLVELQLLFAKGVRQVVRQGLDLTLVDLIRVFKVNTLGRHIVELLKLPRAPLAATRARRPGCETRLASMA